MRKQSGYEQDQHLIRGIKCPAIVFSRRRATAYFARAEACARHWFEGHADEVSGAIGAPLVASEAVWKLGFVTDFGMASGDRHFGFHRRY